MLAAVACVWTKRVVVCVGCILQVFSLAATGGTVTHDLTTAAKVLCMSLLTDGASIVFPEEADEEPVPAVPSLSADAAAVRIQSQARRLEASKRVAAIKQERVGSSVDVHPDSAITDAPLAAVPAVSAVVSGGLTEDEAALRIQSQARRLEASRRVDALKREQEQKAGSVTEPAPVDVTETPVDEAELTPEQAAVLIQSQARRLGATRRVDAIRKDKTKAKYVPLRGVGTLLCT